MTDQRNEVTTQSGRIGFRHGFSPGSIVLGNFQYANRKDDFVDVFYFDGTWDGFPPPPDAEDIFENPVEEDGYAGELSYLFRSRYINLVSGVGYVKKMKRSRSPIPFSGLGQTRRPLSTRFLTC